MSEGSPRGGKRANAGDDEENPNRRRPRKSDSLLPDDQQKAGPSQFTRSRKSAENDGKCSICLSEKKESRTTLSSCSHSFCLVCIQHWIRQQGICPLCKVKSDFISYQKRDRSGKMVEQKVSVEDLMKEHRDQLSVNGGTNQMEPEIAALNIIIRKVRAEIEDCHERERTEGTSATLNKVRENLCVLLNGFRSLCSQMSSGQRSREDIVKDPWFRRAFYEQLLIVNVVPPVAQDVPVTPEQFRENEDLVTRANAFLDQDLPLLCELGREDVKRIILEKLKTFAIHNKEIETAIKEHSSLVKCTRHLMRSLADFLRSGLSLGEYNSRSHHLLSADLVAQNQQNRIDEEDDVEVLSQSGPRPQRPAYFASSVAEALQHFLATDRLRDIAGRQQNDDAVVNIGDSSDDDVIYNRNCVLPRDVQVNRSSSQGFSSVSYEDAMRVFHGNQAPAPSTSSDIADVLPLLGPLIRAHLEGHSRSRGGAPALGSAPQRPETRNSGTQTRERGRAYRNQHQKVVNVDSAFVHELSSDDDVQDLSSGNSATTPPSNEVIHISDDSDDDEVKVIAEQNPQTRQHHRMRSHSYDEVTNPRPSHRRSPRFRSSQHHE
ncbi:hypothetical protein L596_025129 [Steinernema carpocapsae]|uniref:RING-type E3 ubiquitin transferase n=1 Tax=Steinernema carpocapsae TaxID=34508 RepID=A0A4U5M6W3_STECR|nr:hypothetical protein L596_025129 [Steinernema carpocapsae]